MSSPAKPETVAELVQSGVLTPEEAEQELGEEWTKRVKKNGFAGVKVVDLAHSLGFETLYPSMYRPASEGVHAADALDHVRADEERGEFLFSSPQPCQSLVVGREYVPFPH